MNYNPFLTYNKWFVSQGLRESFKGEYVSLWWEQHLVPRLERGEVPPKRFWLHQFHRYQDIYHRMVHDYRDQFNAMLDSLDHKARMNYHRSMLTRPAPKIGVKHGKRTASLFRQGYKLG